MIKYKTDKSMKKIYKVQIQRETESSVFVNRTAWGETKQVRESKSTEWHSYHDTFDEAKSELVMVWQEHINRAKANLERMQAGLEKVMLISEACDDHQ